MHERNGVLNWLLRFHNRVARVQYDASIVASPPLPAESDYNYLQITPKDMLQGLPYTGYFSGQPTNSSKAVNFPYPGTLLCPTHAFGISTNQKILYKAGIGLYLFLVTIFVGKCETQYIHMLKCSNVQRLDVQVAWMSKCEYLIEHAPPSINLVLVTVGVCSLRYLYFVACRVNYLHEHVRHRFYN